MKMAISGICGRMGRAILRIGLERGHTLGAAVDSEAAPDFGRDAGGLVGAPPLGVNVGAADERALAACDAIVDFSTVEGAMRVLAVALAAGRPLVIGTTGFSAAQRKEIDAAGARIPLLFSPNMSVGVNLLFHLAAAAARAVPPGYDVEVFEAHHRHKKDAPSGTALRLIDILKENSPSLASARQVHGRSGVTGERASDEIGVMVMRGGDIVGEHTVYFVGQGERIELTHRATNRDTLASGAVTALEFISRKEPGLYTMKDVLGLP